MHSPSGRRLDFSARAILSRFPELMDGPCSFEELRACLRDIAQVNRLTLAHRPTLHWLRTLRRQHPAPAAPVHIVDVGCGYGDLLRLIARWARHSGWPVRLTGMDLNPDAVRAAQEATPPGLVRYVVGDALAMDTSEPVDVIVSSLMTHHLEDAEIVRFLRWMDSRAALGWFNNDLHRQPVPYHLFRLLARLTRWHRFVQHDGPVSILRSFRRDDWERMCHDAGLAPERYAIEEFRPARLCVHSRRGSGSSAVRLPSASTGSLL